MSRARSILVGGAALCGSGVALGAFGAHWLTAAVSTWGLDVAEQMRRIETWEIAVRYQMYHGLALLAIGALGVALSRRNHPAPTPFGLASLLLLAGVTIFSGCLYGLVLSGAKWLGAVVPLGGLALIAGWIALGCGTWFALSRGEPAQGE